jgi:tetratricopeptide (TPR) repeat protein
MRQVYFLDGQTGEMSERDFLILLKDITNDLMVKTSHFHQIGGFPDVSGGLKSWRQRGAEQRQIFIQQIENDELRGLFHSFDLQVRRIEEELDNQFVALIAEFFGLPAPQTQRDRRKLMRKMGKYGSTGGPVWAAQPEYQRLAEQSRQAFAAVEEIKQRIDDRLVYLISMTDDSEDAQLPTPIAVPARRLLRPRNWDPTYSQPQTIELGEISKEEFGDQRAKDLIDAADGELDPKRAIQLLHRALRYGRTGIQASKAYQGLGMRYEELGDTARAIKYYTKAMEAWHPSAILFFWRGELYYQRGQWTEARNDFEQALAFPPGEGLVSPEREVAERYLVELNAPPEDT